VYKRQHFISKLSDADMENSETQVWLDFALACKYIPRTKYKDLLSKSEETGKMLDFMMRNPEKFNSSNVKKKK
jgi:four helix bundle protein